MADSIRSSFKKLCILTFIHAVYTFLGALLFIYLEECLAKGPSKGKEYEKFKNYMLGLKQLNSNEKERILNITADFFGNTTKICAINRDTVVKWWDFTVVSCATIGYGNVTPKTDLGKISLMVYAFVGIPLTVAMYTVAGEMVINMIGQCIQRIEISLLKRKEVNGMENKKCAVSFVLLTLYIFGVAKIIECNFDNLTIVDSNYLVFQTLTTIGYGDIKFENTFTLAEQIFLLTTASFGMGLTATLTASIVNVIQSVSVKKIIRKFSSSTRSWSLRNAKKESEECGTVTEMNIIQRTQTFSQSNFTEERL